MRSMTGTENNQFKFKGVKNFFCIYLYMSITFSSMNQTWLNDDKKISRRKKRKSGMNEIEIYARMLFTQREKNPHKSQI